MNEVTIQPSRLPISPALAKEYDLTPSIWRVLVEQTFPAAKTIEAVLMALAYCKQRNLDIFKRPVHIVPMWDAKKRQFVETVWEGIASIRTTASRTGAYAGIDAVEYGPMICREFHGEKDVWERGQKTGTETITKKVEYPEWASVIVYRMTGGQRCPYHAKVYWRETYATMGKMDVPNEMWAKRPFGQLDKCVEAAALRKAFPEELGNTYTVDEMEGRTIEGSLAEAEEPKPVPPKPPVSGLKHTQFAETAKKNAPPVPPKPPVKEFDLPSNLREDEVINGETGEVQSPDELLSELDDSLGTAKDIHDIEVIWSDYDLEARLEEISNGEAFFSNAWGIKRKHIKRVSNEQKSDSPTIAMKIEQGRLVPASAFDLELLGRWHEGTVLNIDVARPYVRPLEKKYFAMLSHLIRQADTPWSNTGSAHEAIKLATGFVAPYKRKNGTWGANARHIATFTDSELSEFFELFQGIVRKRFGIDPDTLARDAPDTGSESSGTPSNGRADDDPGAHPIPVGVGVQFTRSSSTLGDVPKAGGTLESTPRDVPSARGPNLRQEEWDWLRMVARMLVSATEPGGDTGIVDRQVSLIKEHYTPPSISPEAKEVAQMIYRHCRAVTKGDRPLDRQWVVDRARCKLDDLRAEAR